MKRGVDRLMQGAAEFTEMRPSQLIVVSEGACIIKREDDQRLWVRLVYSPAATGSRTYRGVSSRRQSLDQFFKGLAYSRRCQLILETIYVFPRESLFDVFFQLRAG